MMRLFQYFDKPAMDMHIRNCRIQFIKDITNTGFSYKNVIYPRFHQDCIVTINLDRMLYKDMDKLLAEYSLSDDKQIKIHAYLRRTLNLCETTGDILRLLPEFLIEMVRSLKRLELTESSITKEELAYQLKKEEPAINLLREHQMTLLLMSHQI